MLAVFSAYSVSAMAQVTAGVHAAVGDDDVDDLAFSDSDNGSADLLLSGADAAAVGDDIVFNSVDSDSETDEPRPREPPVPAFGRRFLDAGFAFTETHPQPIWHVPDSVGIVMKQKPAAEAFATRRNKNVASAEELFRRDMYGTPRCFPCTHYTALVLTSRNLQDLPGQIYFDVGAPEITDRCVHPEFTEWLMGFPKGWTTGSPLDRQAVELHPITRLAASRSKKHNTVSVFTGAGGLDFGLSPWCEPVLYLRDQ